MKTRSTQKASYSVKYFVALVVLLFVFTHILAIETFTMEHKGQTATVTTELDAKYFGMFESTGGMWLDRINLNPDGTGISWTQTLNDSNDPNSGYGWNESAQKPIRWGALVENNEIKVMDFTQVWYGDESDFSGYLLIFQTEDGRVFTRYLYYVGEFQYLGYARKK